MKKPLLVSGDLGLSIGISTGGTPVFGFHPTLLFGREDFYGGVSTNIIYPLSRGPNPSSHSLSILSSRIFAGASMGDSKLKFIKYFPEISYDFFPSTFPKGMIVVGFSIQRIFGE